MKSNFLIILSIFFIFISCKQDVKETASEEKEETIGYYTDKHRPQLHFSPETGWMNDPNGMVYYEGEYHLFYQYYPDDTVWGPMHWGHAVSTDLVHWEHLPIGLYPDELGYIFSGSAVYDENNTSGLGEDGKGPLIAIYTYHDMAKEKAGEKDYQYQAIAYSNDKGRTWTKYEGNPVIPHQGISDFRDPKVFWHNESEQWVMALAVFDHLQLYGSKDLKVWEKLSDFGKGIGSHTGVWECPDLFPITADNGKKYWVLILNMNPGNPQGGSGTQYFVGQFNGKEFTVDPTFEKHLKNLPINPALNEKFPNTYDTGSLWLDQGRDNYAGVTWSNVQKNDGRRLFIGWMSNWAYAQKVPTEKWRSAMTVPWSLAVTHINGVPRLIGEPVKEVAQLETGEKTTIQLGENNLPASGLAHIKMKLNPAKDQTIGFELKNENEERFKFYYDTTLKGFKIDRSKSGDVSFSDEFAKVITAERYEKGETIDFELIIDHSSIEIFIDGGRNIFTELFFPSTPYTIFEVSSNSMIKNSSIVELQRIWNN